MSTPRRRALAGRRPAPPPTAPRPTDAPREVAEALVAATPRPGSFYRVQRGDSLLEVAGAAFGVGAGEHRLRHAQRLNGHEFNRRYWVHPTSAFSRRHFPDGVVSFLPRFACDDAALLRSAGTAARGRCLPLLWIPPPPVGSGRSTTPVASLTGTRPSPGARRRRVEEGRVADHGASPHRWVCYVETEHPDPDRPGQVRIGSGTGVLIGPRHVLTAAHVLHHAYEGSGGTPAIGTASRVRVYPGLHTDEQTLTPTASEVFDSGTSTAVQLHLPATWVSTGGAGCDGDDYAVIDLGRAAKAGGWWGGDQDFRISSGVEADDLAGAGITTTGYPGTYNHFDVDQWEGTGTVRRPAAIPGCRDVVAHDALSVPGMSGGPLWTRAKTSKGSVGTLEGVLVFMQFTVFDLRAYLSDPGAPIRAEHWERNGAVVLTRRLLDQVHAWTGLQL